MTLTNLAALLLAENDREIVLGDLQEAEESTLQSVRQISSLVLRRQLELWKSWRPWLAAFGVAMPNSFALMGISVYLSWATFHFLSPVTTIGSNHAVSPGLLPFLCQIFLLLICSWAGGYVVGSISRKTLWASVVLCASPMLFCFSRFGIQSLSKYCLFLFVLPGVMGIHHALRRMKISSRSAMFFAGAATISMICLWTTRRFFLLDCTLLWPVWYMAATNRPAIQVHRSIQE